MLPSQSIPHIPHVSLFRYDINIFTVMLNDARLKQKLIASVCSACVIMKVCETELKDADTDSCILML